MTALRPYALYVLAFILCLLPPALAFRFIHDYGVNVAVVDDFFFVDGFTQYFSGTLSPDYFINLHNDHCLFFGKILMLVLGLVTHFNIIAEMFLSWTFLLLTLFLFAYLVITTLGRKPGVVLLVAPVSLLLFSLRPWDVFLNGSVFLNSMTIFFTMLSIVLLSRSNRVTLSFWAATLCGILGTFSGSASGLIIWPIGLLQIIPPPVMQKPSDVPRFAFDWLRQIISTPLCQIWMTASALCIGTYGILRWQSHQAHAATEIAGGSFIHHATMVPSYLLTLLGFPFCTDLAAMQACGAGALALYACIAAIYLINRPFGARTTGIRAAGSIFLFGLLAIALITFGRSERGYLEATATRYVQFSEIMLIGAYLAVGFSEFKHRATQISLLAMLLGMMAVSAFVGYSVAPMYGTFWRNLQLKNAYILRTYKIQGDKELSLLQSNAAFVKTQAAALEKMKLNVFARSRQELDNVPVHAEQPAYCVDRINTEPSPKLPVHMKVGQTESITVSGWAFDKNSLRPGKRIALIINGSGAGPADSTPIRVPSCNGLRYPGVEETFHAKGLLDCGFFASFSPGILKPGAYTIKLAIESSDGTSITLSKPLIELDVR